MAQRALIIGLGSTGYDICNYISQRIQWEQGGMDRVPWLKFLILETEPASRLGELEQNYVHLTIEGNDYEGLINNPGRYKSQLDLESWWDKEALLRLGDRALTKGAGNIRMVGRLAFLYPTLCSQIRNGIQARLDALQSLTPQQARAARGKLSDGSDPEILLGEETVVYVVGTLCGGTCSGAFIDLGYLLHYQFASTGYKIHRRGLFSIPNTAYEAQTNRRRRANAFAALKELNHFMSGHEYSVQYPFHAGHPEKPTRFGPYDTTYLCQPSGGDENAFERVKITTAQFLHNDVFNDVAAQIGAKTVDSAASTYSGDKNGSPTAFYSLGTSAVEIPGYLIAQGCCYKLGVEALDAFIAPRPNALQEADAFRIKNLGISSEEMSKRLLRDPDGDPTGEAGQNIPARLQKAVADAVAGAATAGRSAANDLAAAEERVNAAFTARNTDSPAVSDSQATNVLPPHIVPRRIEANSQILRGIYARDLDREIQLALRDPARGPVWCETILDETQKYLERRLQDLSSNTHADNLERAAKSTRNALSAARARVEACALDPFVALYIGRQGAVKRELISYSDAANAAYRRRLEAMLFGPEKSLCEALLPQVMRMRAQITGASASDDKSVLAQTRQMRSILAAKLQRVDEATPVINGKSLFEPGQTIDAKYQAFWSAHTPDERARERAAFLSNWKRLPRADKTTGQLTELGGYFTDGTATPATGENLTRQLRQTAEELAREQRPLFGPVLQERILDRPEISDPVLLKDVRDKSALMIGLNRQAGLIALTGNNEVDLIFFDGAKNAANQPDSKANDLYRALERLKTPGVTMRFEESPSQQELLCVRVLGGFSLAMIHGFQPNELEGSNFRDSFEQENAETFNVYSRVGIKWQPFDGDRDRLAPARQGLLLTGMCFPRAGTASDFLIQRTNQGYLYRPPRPLGPGRDRVLLPLDLREAADALREQPEFLRCLEDDIKRVRVAKPVDEIAVYLEWLYDNSEKLGIQHTQSRFSLRYEDDESKGDTQSQIAREGTTHADITPLSDAEAFELIKTYWRNDAALLSRLQARYNQDHLPPEAPVAAPFPGAMTGGVAADAATPSAPVVPDPVVVPLAANVTPFPAGTVEAPRVEPVRIEPVQAPVQIGDDLDFT